MDEAERRRMAERLMELRRTQTGGTPKPSTAAPKAAVTTTEPKPDIRLRPVRTMPAPKQAVSTAAKAPVAPEHKPTPAPTPTVKKTWRPPKPVPASSRHNSDQVLKNQGMRIVYDAAKEAGREIDFVVDSSRSCALTRFEIDRRLTEIHYVRKATEKKQPCARVQFSRSRVVLGELDHLVLIDIEERGVLSAYRFTSEYLKWRLFTKWKEKAELLIPLDGDSVLDLHRLDWPLKRPRPAD